MMSGNYPAFALTTTTSNVALAFSLHGIKIAQIGGEIDLGGRLD